MALTLDQILASHRTQAEALFSITNATFDGFEKMMQLGLSASRTALNDAASHTQAVLSAKDPQSLMALQANAVQPMAEKTASYGRQVYDIAAQTSTQVGQILETRVTEGRQVLAGAVENVTRNAPAGSEAAIAVVKSAVTAANNAFESMQRAVKQASDATQANFETATANVAQAASRATASTSRRR
ncbi:MAG: phasin family protein [Xylophilus ampelinus]